MSTTISENIGHLFLLGFRKFYPCSNGGVDKTKGVLMINMEPETLEAPDSLRVDVMMSYLNGRDKYNTTIKAGGFCLIKSKPLR